MAYYIYGVIEADKRLEFGPIGLGEKPVYTIGVGGIAFVISEAVLNEYIANSLNLGEHERVLETIMKERVILPMRFGSVASNEKELLLMLKKHHSTFLRMFKKLLGKVEVEVEILWKDMKAVFDEIVSANPKLKQLKTSATPKQRDEVIMAGQMVYQLLQDKKRRESEEFIKILKRVSENYVVNKSTRDEMMINASFLIDKGKLNEFDKALDLLDAKTGRKFNIRYIGPLPPYSFVGMRVK